MIVVLNQNSNCGKGKLKWDKIKQSVQEIEGSFEVISEGSRDQVFHKLDKSLSINNEQTIISAGGDGSFNDLLNFLMDSSTDKLRFPVTFGAIGIGSSNDLHKPNDPDRKILKIPVILPSMGLNQSWDLGKAVIQNSKKEFVRYFCINSSFGLTAQGNDFFNQSSLILNSLKKIHLELANFWTILNILARPKKIKTNVLKIRDGIDATILSISNANILKKRNISGGMNFDTEVEIDDGLLDFTLCQDMTRFELVSIIVNLYKGRFLRTPKTIYIKRDQLNFIFDEEIPLEFDGEIVFGHSVKYSVVPRAIQIC